MECPHCSLGFDMAHLNRKMLIAALVLANVVLVLFWNRSRNSLSDVGVPPSNEAVDDGDAPIQRRRTDSFIAQVKEMDDFEKLAEGLNAPVDSELDIVFAAGGFSIDLSPQTHFMRVVADRRVSRLYEILSAQMPTVASRKSRDLFDAKLGLYETAYFGLLDDWVDGDDKITPVPILLIYHAVCGAFFLCSAFCNYNEIDECINQ